MDMSVKHLAIELSPDSVKFTSHSGDITVLERSYDFKDKKDYRYKEQLDEFIGNSGLKERDHDEHSISWSSLKTTLVPSNVFGESDKDSIFKLCFGSSVPTSEIDYNRLPELGIVNIYEIPVWVKNYFVIRHPRSVIQHESSMILRNLFTNTPFKLKIVLVPYKSHFLLLIADAGKLQFYSVFEYQNAEDILYNLMFTLQQKELLEKDGEIIWSNGVGSSEDISGSFEQLKSRVNNLKGLKFKVDPQLITNSHKLCV